MRIPVNKVADALRAGATAKRDTDAPVRVAVFVDASASAFLIDTVRGALVPATTSALVRVERLSAAPVVKPDTDVTLVLTCGSEGLQEAVQQLVIGGAPVAVLAESSVEAPFIADDTPMLGLIAATSRQHLLDALARWILARTDKGTAFAANFPFMREAAGNEVVVSTALTNALTGALVFVPSANYPMMTLAQLGMMAQLALVYGKPLKAERGYEAAAIALSGLALRAGVRRLVGPAGSMAFAVKALAGGLGTYAMGRALMAAYERDVDYTRLNEALAGLARAGRGLAHAAQAASRAQEGGARTERAGAQGGI